MFGAGVGDVGEGFQRASLSESAAEVVAALVEDAVGDFLEAAGAELGDHAAGRRVASLASEVWRRVVGSMRGCR